MTIRELRRRVAGTLGLGRRDADLDRELAFHREMLEARHRARGLDAEAAARAARLELGGAAQIAETWRDQRGLPFFDTLRQDVRYGLRVLRRTPAFTAAALTTLALGIGANTAVFTVVDAVLLRPLPYAEPDRLVTVGDRDADGLSGNVGFATLIDWRTRSRSFESLALMRTWEPTLAVNGEAERLDAARVSWNYFDTLGVRPALGRGFSADDDRPDHWRVVLLSDRLWRRRFSGDPSVVGRTTVMNDREYRILGVMPPHYEPLAEERYFNATAEIWAPIGYDLNGDSSCRSCRHLRAFGRLARGATVAEATAEMNGLRQQMRREHPTDYEPGSIAIVPLHDALTAKVQTALHVLLGAVGFVLLIACANVANLLLSRSITRRHELAMRAVLGAGRRRIVRQLLTEGILLGVGGAIGGIVLARAAVQGLTGLAPVSLPRLAEAAIDARVLAFTAGIALMTSLFFGLLPASRAAGATQQTLAVDSRGSIGGRSTARSMLVIADLILALVLLAGAGVMLRTVAAVTRASPGFEPSRVLSLQFSLVGKAYAEDPQVLAFQDRLLEKLRALPGVEGAALADQIPFGGNYDCRGFHAKSRMRPNPSEDPCIERYGITPGYHQVMGIPLLAGRLFTDADTATSQPVLVISESTARLVFSGADPIGEHVRLGSAASGEWRAIVGVVGDVHHQDVAAPPTPAVYVPETQLTDSYLVAVLKAAKPDAAMLAGPARAAIRELDASVPTYDVATLPALVEKASAQRVFVMRLLGGFALVALLLAAVGLYGVVSYGVTQRTREIGVRLALGAARGHVTRLVLGNGFALVTVGVVVGLGAALISTRTLGSLVYGVSPWDPIALLCATAILLAVTLLAHWVPVRRALRIDPASALRTE